MGGWDHVTTLTELEKRCASLWFRVDPASVPAVPTGLLVGEMPGESTRSYLPLFPYPPNSAGGRLLKMSGIPVATYLGRLRRRNLFLNLQKWDNHQAVMNAREIVLEQRPGTRVILCGQRVAEAFGFDRFFHMHDQDGVFYTAIPHPSGRNLMYNDSNTRFAAAAALQWAADCTGRR